MHLVVCLVSGILKSLEKGIEEREESVYRRKARDSGVTREVYHSLFDVLISNILSCSLIVLLFVKYGQLFADGGTDGIVLILATLDSIE